MPFLFFVSICKIECYITHMQKDIRDIINYAGQFGAVFSFRPLIKYWEKQSASNPVFSPYYEKIKEKLEAAPELLEPVTDRLVVEKHYGLIVELLNICFPPAIHDNELYAAVYPQS